MRRLAIVFACVFLCGCAMQPMAPEKAAQYKRIGVLSAMGDRFATGAIGLTVFQNENRQERLEFGADDLFTEKVKQALAAKYAIVDLTKYRAAFMEAPKYWPGQAKIIGEDRPSVSEVVRRLMGAEGLDAYLFITPAAAAVIGTNQGVGGIGVYQFKRIFSANEFRLHAAYIVAVVDGKDYAVVADMRADRMGGGSLNAPNVPVPAQFWDAPAANKNAIRAAFDKLITPSVPETLRRANLIE